MQKQGVIITGGNRGIGRVIAERFLEEGCSVAVCSRSNRDISLPSDILHARMDVRKREEMNQWVTDIAKSFGSLRTFVNCAGISQWKPVTDIDEKFVEEVIESSLLGTLWGSAAAAKVLQPGGSIVNISSLAGKRGSANNSAYCASKFAVNGITQSLAKELGPRGIRVNAVCPVYVTTATILESLKSKESPVRGASVKAYLEDFSKTQTALGRLPTEKEVANVVYFLASDKASAVTGQCINVDCGVLPQ